jgi:Transposase/DDE superfamily endonuclease
MEGGSGPGRTTANLSDLEVAYILGMADAGASKSAISVQTSRSRSAVANAIEKYNIKTFTGVPPPPGNPKTVSQREKRTLLHTTRKNRRKTLEDITNILPDNPSKRTLQRRLSTLGIKKHIAIKKPFLTDEHKRKRLAFCEEHKDWTVEMWKRVIFSDECKVEIGKQARAVWVFRNDQEKYQEDCLVPALKGSRASVMVWGCFSANKLGPLLTFPKGGINSMDYITTLQNGLLPFIQRLNGITEPTSDSIEVATMGEYIFQQDNAPIHTSGPTKRFFESHHLLVMDWPANSPDLNPIEHLWPHLKARFHKEWEVMCHGKVSRSEDALELYARMMKRIWEEELETIADNLVESMPRRVEAVWKAGGGHSKY